MPSEDKTPVSKIDETKPVVWTAEDASRFMTSAIREAQKPLADALKQRPMTSRALTLVISVIIAAALIIGLILSNQLEKTEQRAERAQLAREEILGEKMVLQAQTQALEDRLNAIQNRHDDLYGQVADLKMNEERYRRTVSELSRFRQNNEILREYISGLEDEKAALSNKLMKALAIEPGTDAELDAIVNATDVPPAVVAAPVVTPPAEPATQPEEPAAPPQTPVAPGQPETPESAEPAEAVVPVTESPVTEPGGAMAPPVVSEPAALSVGATTGSALPAAIDEPSQPEAAITAPEPEPQPEPAEAVGEEPATAAGTIVEEGEDVAAVDETPESDAALVNEEALIPPPSSPVEARAAEADGETYSSFESTSEQYGASLASDPEETAEPELIVPVADESAAAAEEPDTETAPAKSDVDAIVDEVETVMEATYSQDEIAPVDEQVEDMIVEGNSVIDDAGEIIIVDAPLESVNAPEEDSVELEETSASIESISRDGTREEDE